MKISELRVGNYVEGFHGADPYKHGYDIDKLSIEDMAYLYEYADGEDSIYVDGVPLTEEWLLKFGAIELISLNDGYKRFDLNGIHLSISPPDRDWFVEYVHQIPIKYVHTLQNFYFATRQEELERV